MITLYILTKTLNINYLKEHNCVNILYLGKELSGGYIYKITTDKVNLRRLQAQNWVITTSTSIFYGYED